MTSPWKSTVVGALVLSGVAATMNITLAWTGYYTILWLGLVAVLGVELVGLLLILRTTAKAGFGFRRQLAAGGLATAILALLMFPTTIFALTVAAPDYVEVFTEMQRAQLESDGMSQEEIEEHLPALREIARPVNQALYTMLATVVTCAPMVLVIAIFVRRRGKGSEDDGDRRPVADREPSTGT